MGSEVEMSLEEQLSVENENQRSLIEALEEDLKGERNSAAYWKDLAETREKGYAHAEAEVARLTKQVAELTTVRERRGMGFGDSQVECPTCLNVDSSSSVIKAVAPLRKQLTALQAAARALVEALPRCTRVHTTHGVEERCRNVATGHRLRGISRYCDDCTAGRKDVPEYPRAAPLRALLALLTDSAAPPPGPGDRSREGGA